MAEHRSVRELKHDSGQLLARIEQVNGKPHGLMQEWSLDGKLSVEAHFNHGQYHGEYKSWWDNGQLKEEGTYHNGQRVGRYRWYKSDGNLQRRWGSDLTFQHPVLRERKGRSGASDWIAPRMP